MILVFTFGFLVWRKVDLHHQKLTQASIGPQVEDASIEQALMATQSTAITDSPFTDLNADSSSADSSFTDSSLTDSSLTDSSLTTTENSNSSEFLTAQQQISNPEPTEQAANDFFSGNEPAQPTEFEFQAVSKEPDVALMPPEDVPNLSMMAEPDTIADSGADSGNSLQLEINPSATDADRSSEAVESSDFTEAFSALPSPDASPAKTEAAIEIESSVVAGQEQGQDAIAFSLTPEPASEPASELQTETEIAKIPAEDSLIVPEQASETAAVEQPMLLAMAEPPKESPGFEAIPSFEGGLSPAEEEHPASTRAPDTSDTFLPVADQPVSELSPSPSAAASPFDTTMTADTASPAGTSGRLRATPSTRVSPAIATTADGKFSLAAFNYQHNVAPPVNDGNTYEFVEVRKGDNYSAISKRVYGSSRYFSALAVFNQHRISDPAKMRPGMKVLTPPKEILEERFPQLFPEIQTAAVQPSGFFLQDDGSPAFRIGTGSRETLSELSERFLGRSSRWTEIYQLNQSVLKDPNKLKPGIVLVLPDDAVEVNVAP